MRDVFTISVLLAFIYGASIASAAAVKSPFANMLAFNSPVAAMVPFRARGDVHVASSYDLVERSLNLEENLDPRIHARWDESESSTSGSDFDIVADHVCLHWQG